MTIKRRIALVAAGAVAISVVLMAVAAFLFARSQYMQQIDDALQQRIDTYAELSTLDIPSRTDNRYLDSLPGRVSADFDATYVQVVTERGTVNIGPDQLRLPPVEGPVPLGTTTFRSEWVDGVHVRIAATAVAVPRRFLQVARPLTETDEALSGLAILLTVGGGIGVLLAAGIGFVVARAAIRPIGDLEDDVSGISQSREFGRRVDVSGTDEVAQLGHAFNGLLDELELVRAEQSRLVRDAGHELRTPLTALRTNIEILTRHDVPSEERMRMLESANAEVEELSILVAEVVDLATDRYTEEPHSTFRLKEVVDDVVEALTRRSDREVFVEADDSVVKGRRAAINRAVTNIVTNADKWSPNGAPIRIEVEKGTVTVTDEGPGIPEEDIPHVFERFYRSADARAMPGSGLGLSIVDTIVSDHGGRVFASNGRNGGAIVGFSIESDDSAAS